MALTDAKKRVLERLKHHGAQTPAELGIALEFTDVAARQHLQALVEDGHVRFSLRAGGGRGRPATEWSLTEQGHRLFPDRHGELTIALLDAARQAFGEEGVERLLDIRAQEQITAYRERLGLERDLEGRVRALADLRTEEGYMAESLPTVSDVADPARCRNGEEDREDKGFLLVEHHCPICDAAKACAGLCAKELEVFQRALGPAARVERQKHLLAGDQRCVYRVTAISEAEQEPADDADPR